jgi:hypothetical protein
MEQLVCNYTALASNRSAQKLLLRLVVHANLGCISKRRFRAVSQFGSHSSQPHAEWVVHTIPGTQIWSTGDARVPDGTQDGSRNQGSELSSSTPMEHRGSRHHVVKKNCT